MTMLWAVVPLALDKPPNPADVKQGWIGFVVFMALAVAVVLLWLSFRKQLKKVTFDEDRTARPAPDEHRPVTGNGTTGQSASRS
jgi:hypothetical protein